MPYIYPSARALDGKPKVGDLECVALIRHYTNAPPALAWREGDKLLGNKNIQPGTAIATFVHGKWPGRAKGNHAAFYLGQVSDGIYVIDQWSDSRKATISKRFIQMKGKNKDGTYRQPSDNAEAFSIIR